MLLDSIIMYYSILWFPARRLRPCAAPSRGVVTGSPPMSNNSKNSNNSDNSSNSDNSDNSNNSNSSDKSSNSNSNNNQYLKLVSEGGMIRLEILIEQISQLELSSLSSY